MARNHTPAVDYNEIYSPDVQKVYLDCLISDPDAFARVRSILKEEYFHSTVRSAVRFILSYSDEHRSIPAPEIVRAKTGVAVEKLAEIEASKAHDWLLKEIEGFCRHKAMENIIFAGPDLLAKGQGGEIERLVRDAMTISLMSDLGTDYFEDPRARLERIRDKSSFISTGWSALDAKLYGGFTRGALNIFAGGSGSGKSLFLQNIALNWAFAGLNVIYISLELSEELIAMRMDAMVSGRGTSELFANMDTIVPKIAMTGRNSGHITIKRLPEGGTSANTIRAYLKEYEIKTGIHPDAIVIDYLDLLYPNSQHVDASDHFVKDKYVSEELRALAHEFNLLCATASQLNRQSIEAMGDFDHSHIAGGISKINTADNVFGIFTTMTMREKGTYVLQFLKTRSAAAVGQKIELGYDPVSMRITDPLIAVDDPNRPTAMNDLRAQLAAKAGASAPGGGSAPNAGPPKAGRFTDRVGGMKPPGARKT